MPLYTVFLSVLLILCSAVPVFSFWGNSESGPAYKLSWGKKTVKAGVKIIPGKIFLDESGHGLCWLIEGRHGRLLEYDCEKKTVASELYLLAMPKSKVAIFSCNGNSGELSLFAIVASYDLFYVFGAADKPEFDVVSYVSYSDYLEWYGDFSRDISGRRYGTLFTRNASYTVFSDPGGGCFMLDYSSGSEVPPLKQRIYFVRDDKENSGGIVFYYLRNPQRNVPGPSWLVPFAVLKSF